MGGRASQRTRIGVLSVVQIFNPSSKVSTTRVDSSSTLLANYTAPWCAQHIPYNHQKAIDLTPDRPIDSRPDRLDNLSQKPVSPPTADTASINKNDSDMDRLDRTTHSGSPQPSPHGAIGERASTPLGHLGHGRSSSLAQRQRADSLTDELDLASLIPHDQRQADLERDDLEDRERHGRAGFARFNLEAPHSRTSSPARQSRWEKDFVSRSRETSMRRQASTNSVGGIPPPSIPNIAVPPANLAFIDQSFPSPLRPTPPRHMSPHPDPVPSPNPAAAVSHHLQSLTSLLRHLMSASDDVARLRAEVDMWRAEWQRCDRERRRLETLVSVGDAGPVFTAVLIDGDSLVFDDAYIRKGYAGGQQAARALQAAAAGEGEGAMLVHVFVNKSGLGHALVKAGTCSWAVYEAFWQGFAAADPLWTVCDAGHSQDAVDAKIAAHLRLLAQNRQCVSVVLGAEVADTSSKVVPLRASPGGRAIYVPDLFRTTRLSIPSSPVQVGPPPVPGEGDSDPDVGEEYQGRAESDEDWDERKKGAPGKKYKPAQRAASVPTVRNLKPRPCHTFYLSPWGCKNGDGCEYAHHYKLNEEQTEELARLAKEIICPYVRSKRCHFSEDECVYGHRCPRGERCTFGDTCRFKDLPNGHGEDSPAPTPAATRPSTPAPAVAESQPASPSISTANAPAGPVPTQAQAAQAAQTQAQAATPTAA